MPDNTSSSGSSEEEHVDANTINNPLSKLSIESHRDLFDEVIGAAQYYANGCNSNLLSFYNVPWISILTRYFPTEEGFVVMPTGNVIELNRLERLPGAFQTVLIVHIANPKQWVEGEKGIAKSMTSLQAVMKTSFRGWAGMEVYWISVIGQHWRYGIAKESGMSDDILLEPMSDWNHSMKESEFSVVFKEIQTSIDQLCPKFDVTLPPAPLPDLRKFDWRAG